MPPGPSAPAFAPADAARWHPDEEEFGELGMSEMPAAWWGIVTAAGVPDAVTRRINSEFVRTFRDPKFTAYLDSQLTESNVGTPEEFGALIRTDRERFGQMVRRFRIERE